MALSVHICLLVASALLLCSSTLCLGSKYEYCIGNASTCAGFYFGYPFGQYGSGCGDPAFQLLSCDTDGHPRFNISGHGYDIVPNFFLGNNSDTTIIVNDNLWADKCPVTGSYLPFWWSAFDFHISTDTYANLTRVEHCNENLTGTNFQAHWLPCRDEWYYFSSPDTAWQRICQTPLQLPSKIIIIGNLLNNKSILGQGLHLDVNLTKNQSCEHCLKSNGTCGYDIAEPTKFLCYYPEAKGNQNKNKNKNAIIIGCSIGGVAIAAVLFLTYYTKKRKTHSRGLPANYFSKYERKDNEAIGLPERRIGNLPIFSYEELRQATGSFHEKNEIGDGGFGSVYLGKLRDGRTVAVKRLYQDNSRRLQQFINEVEIFSSVNHPYVVRLFGYTSPDSPELLLVYEFVSNGTLADHLHGDRKGPKGLPWDTRLNIAIQIAQALAFLHSVDPPIFHRDVKSTNILLDEKFNVKVADFGLCRLLPVDASHVTTAPQGTPGYVDPEYHECFQLTEKSDVYSFGVVLVEIISAKLAVDISRKRGEINLAFMAISKIQEGALNELVDPQLEIEKNDHVKIMVTAVAELVFRCLALGGDDRPHMKEVVAQLEQIRDASQTPGKRQWESFPNMKHSLSPISVQDRWPSLSSSSDNSA